MIELLWLLLPVAAASGWWAAKRDTRNRKPARDPRSIDYFQGLAYLLEDKPDKAIEVFVRMVEVDRDTAETHLTLGNLFRRRGEVDRAIHIHRNLMARSNLTPEQRVKAMQELGEDYLRAGLFDRAEVLYRELAEIPGQAPLALERLSSVYQQEKDWQQAIACFERLEQLGGRSCRREIAHLNCELAEQALRGGKPEAARVFIDQALTKDPECVRASMLRGYLAMNQHEFATAAEALQSVGKQDRRYLSEVIFPLASCYEALGRMPEFLAYLRRVQGLDHTGVLTEALADYLEAQMGRAAALSFVEQELEQHATFRGLSRLVELRLADHGTLERRHAEALQRASKMLLDDTTRYRCETCGFAGKAMHWRCPGCKSWGSITPVPDMTCRGSA